MIAAARYKQHSLGGYADMTKQPKASASRNQRARAFNINCMACGDTLILQLPASVLNGWSSHH